jgi:sugar/nucleoside kinase (ribokinase family)
METDNNVDIMMFGHFAKDRLVYGDRDETSSGGGVFYGSIALRRLGLRVSIVTRLHPDDFERLDQLKREGVRVFASPAPQTSGIANFYDPTDLDKRAASRLALLVNSARKIFRT